MNAFMEETNIRWGELVGGLLIVCCSVALVISFWEHIASRPWLKFSIFTGINIATFGLGLYAWHRWKLPTTSKGILLIGMMLLPLNFLAFALFTLGMPWHWPTIIAEMTSLAILGSLAWQAAKVLTPNAVAISTATPVAFALANLLVRRTFVESVDPSLLVAWGLGLMGLYATVNGIAWKPLLKRAEGNFVPAMEFLALSTFGVLLAGGLLLRCSAEPSDSFRLLSPLLCLLAAPPLFFALDIGRRIERQSPWILPMVLLGASAIAIASLSMFFSWPVPIRMLASVVGWLVLIGVVAVHVRQASIAYPVYLIASAGMVLVWFCARGDLDWWNDSSQRLIQTVTTATTGFIWVACSLMCVGIAVLLAKLRFSDASVTALRSGAIVGVLGTIVLTALGFGREAYSTSVGAVYAIYAIVAFAIGIVRRKPWVEGVGVAFLSAAAIQWIAFGWVDEHWLTRAFASTAGVSTSLLVLMMIKHILGEPARRDSILSNATLSLITATSLIAWCWFLVGEASSLLVDLPFSIHLVVIASLLWFLLTWVQPEAPFWRIAQWSFIASCMAAVILVCKQAPWWLETPSIYLHPMWLQYASLTLFLSGAVCVLLHWTMQRAAKVMSASIVGPLLKLHDSGVGHYAIAAASITTLGLFAYGAYPGTAQELIPRNALASTEVTTYVVGGKTQERNVPKLSALELRGIPHAASSWGLDSDRYRVWGMPPMWAAWIVGLAALGCVCWDSRRSDWWSLRTWSGLTMALFLALWYAMASRSESSIAVASSLRWLTSFFFFVASLGLCFWIRRIDRSKEPDASTAFHWFDHAFASLSLNTLVPWIAMGTIVIASVLVRAQVLPWTGWAWFITGLMALFAALLAMIQFSSAHNKPQQQMRSMAGISAATLLAAPFVTWVILQVAVTVMKHPLTGPNPDTWFATLGLAGSYATPILLISVALLSVSASRPSPHLAFISAMFLMATVVVGYMLILKSKGLRVEAWVGLAAALSLTASIFSLLWRAYTDRDHRTDALLHWTGRPAKLVRQEWQTALQQVSAGFLIVGLLFIILVVIMQPQPMSGLSWASSGILVAILLPMVIRFLREDAMDLAPWIGAIGVSFMGMIAPWWGTIDHSLAAATAVMTLTGAAMIGNSSRGLFDDGIQDNPRRVLIVVYLILAIIALRVLAYRAAWFGPGPMGGVGFLPVGILCCAFGLAVAHSWLHRDRWSWLWSLLLGQAAGFITTLFALGAPPSWPMRIWDTLFVQCSVMALVSGIGTLFGFGRRVRIPLVMATGILTLVSGGWMLVSLVSNSSALIPLYPIGTFGLAILGCLLGGITGYWNPYSRDEHGVVYLSGLCGVVLFLQWLAPSPNTLLWMTAIVLAAYCLATSFLWRAGRRLHEELAMLVRLPKPCEKPPASLVIAMNIGLALIVAWLATAAQFYNPTINIRFTCAQAIMAVAFAVGFLARYVSSSSLQSAYQGTFIRVIALGLGVLSSITLFWHVQPIQTTTWWDRASVATLPLTLIGATYGFGLIKWMGLKAEWEKASRLILPWIVVVAISGCIACIAMEYQQAGWEGSVNFPWYPTVCIALSLIIALVLCISAALLPGRDPLGLSEKDREWYVYTAQVVFVLLVIHLRLAIPWLFSGVLQRVWPLLLMGLGFGGMAVAEWAERRGWKVLVQPLRNSGMLLPLLPILAPWVAASRIDYGVTLVMASIGYGLFAYIQRSPFYMAASVMAANGAIWYLLHRIDFSFSQHPQLWVIPPALCVFAAAQLLRDRLSANQLAGARYASVGSIYVASTSEIFLQGISNAPWLPIVLAFLSVVGILYGIAARIRSMLWLGSMFLCVALFSILWYAAVDLEQTWIWYVSGIVLGAVILIVFALFEKRREELKRIMNRMQEWEE
jgi:hypothetical protein